MFKNIKNIAMLFVATLIMVSCTTGNERKIVGIWKNADTHNSYYHHPPKYMEFKKDGTVIINETTALNYKIVDNDLIIRSEWYSEVFKIEILTRSKLRLYNKEEGGTLYYDKIEEITLAMRYGFELDSTDGSEYEESISPAEIDEYYGVPE